MQPLCTFYNILYGWYLKSARAKRINLTFVAHLQRRAFALITRDSRDFCSYGVHTFMGSEVKPLNYSYICLRG
jgi:hypothetical protein